ncbi:MAG: hypothetical protein F6K03_00710, partial [Kamptonema sp. SIO4C4]|nr:hypothetical protein [Kamptonema sp. SIO4C4]
MVTVFFYLQLLSYFFSVLVLTHGVNQLVLRVARSQLDSRYLPCFAWGWVIYFLIFMLGRWADAPVELIRGIFTGMAFILSIVGAIEWWLKPQFAFWTQRRQELPIDRGTLLVTGLFIGIMIYIGPYLEFPSDPLDYLYRVQAWEKVRFMDYAYHPATTSAAFTEHWLLLPSGISFGERGALAVLSAVQQGILFWEFIRIAYLLTGKRTVSILGAVLSLGTFGYFGISFYRYTVFSGSMFAYHVYLEALVLIFAIFLTERWQYLLFLPLLMWVCWNNHEQETLLQIHGLVGIGFVLLLFRFREFSPAFRRQLFLGLILVVSIGWYLLINQDILARNTYLEEQSFFLFPVFTVRRHLRASGRARLSSINHVTHPGQSEARWGESKARGG